MFIDKTNGLLDKIKQFAITNNLQENLENNLSCLKRHIENGCEVTLYPDFAPLSLYFEITREGNLCLNGGVIFHGKHDNGGNGQAPTFSVSLQPSKGWQIHT